MPEPSPFLRFDVVSVNYRRGRQPVAEKCESIRKLLLPFKFTSALNGAKLEFTGQIGVNYRPGQQQITAKCESSRKLLLPLSSALNGAKLELDGRIDRNDLSDFSDHSMLLAHLGNDLLPICNGFRAYEFRISFLSEKTAPNVISLILGMGPARNCANVKFVILGIDQPTPLPVEAITNWFSHSVTEERQRKNRGKKSLEIRMENISNGPEIQTRLKEANCGFFFEDNIYA